ncbi:hypothetical protein CF319_g8283 [Tilletia indica]|nr:hypothetical protein CF319_g8283 [Tilletia indica]
MLLEGNGTPRIVEATLTSQSKRHALVWEQCGTNESKKEPRCLKLKIGLQQSLHMRVYLDPCVRSPGKPSARCDFTLGCGPVEPLSSQQIEELAAVHKLTIQDARTCVVSIKSVACSTVSPTVRLTTLRRGPEYARMAARLQQILVGPFGTTVMPLLKREGEEVVIPISLLARDSSVPHGGHHGKIILTNPVRLPLFRGLDLGMEPVWKAAYHAFQHPAGSETEADQVGEDTVDAQIDRDLIDELEETLAAETKTIRHLKLNIQPSIKPIRRGPYHKRGRLLGRVLVWRRSKPRRNHLLRRKRHRTTPWLYHEPRRAEVPDDLRRTGPSAPTGKAPQKDRHLVGGSYCGSENMRIPRKDQEYQLSRTAPQV